MNDLFIKTQVGTCNTRNEWIIFLMNPHRKVRRNVSWVHFKIRPLKAKFQNHFQLFVYHSHTNLSMVNNINVHKLMFETVWRPKKFVLLKTDFLLFLVRQHQHLKTLKRRCKNNLFYYLIIIRWDRDFWW